MMDSAGWRPYVLMAAALPAEIGRAYILSERSNSVRGVGGTWLAFGDPGGVGVFALPCWFGVPEHGVLVRALRSGQGGTGCSCRHCNGFKHQYDDFRCPGCRAEPPAVVRHATCTWARHP